MFEVPVWWIYALWATVATGISVFVWKENRRLGDGFAAGGSSDLTFEYRDTRARGWSPAVVLFTALGAAIYAGAITWRPAFATGAWGLGVSTVVCVLVPIGSIILLLGSIPMAPSSSKLKVVNATKSDYPVVVLPPGSGASSSALVIRNGLKGPPKDIAGQ